MPELTDREREILTLIARSIEANGYQPSYRDIARHFGWSSIGWIHRISRSLTSKKVVTVRGARAWAFEWKHYLKESSSDAQGTDGSSARVPARCDVRRRPRRGGHRLHRQARAPGGGLE